MPAIARTTDLWTGICFAHKRPIPTMGMIVSGEPNVTCDSKPVATLGSVCISFCGHAGIVLGMAAVGSANGKPIARVGDPVVGPFIGNIINGSFVGDCR